MSDFTPGPWLYRPHETDDWGVVRTIPTEDHRLGGVICQAHDPRIRARQSLSEHRRAGTDPWEANARLIAAAPELYEALEAIMREDDATLSEVNARLEAGRAALAKARGEA